MAAAARTVDPAWLHDPRVFAEDAAVQKVVAALVKARPVRINPDRAAIRFLGTRFVIDSYILDQLVYPNVGTSEKPRLLPSALDLAAVLGSDFAYQVEQKAGASSYANYDSQVAKLKQEVADRPAADWGSTVYDAWLVRAPAAVRPAREAVPRLHAHAALGREGRADRARLLRAAQARHRALREAVRRRGWR